MAYEYVLYEKKDHIATITLNRPEVMNAVHPPTTAELSGIWDDAIADDSVWVILLTGAGERAFSAGNDLKYTASKGMPTGPPPKGGFGGLTDRTDIDKPMIAAVSAVDLRWRWPATSSLRPTTPGWVCPSRGSGWPLRLAGCTVCRARSRSKSPWAIC